MAVTTHAALALLAAIGLAACNQSSGVLDDLVNPGATEAAERACLAQVNRINGDSTARVVASSPDGAAASVRLRDARDNGTWRCRASNGGIVEDLSFN